MGVSVTSSVTDVTDEMKDIEQSQETRVEINHTSDSLTLLLYLGLLALTLLTVWIFKHRRLRYFHETGLSIIYGLVVGIIIRYGSSADTQTNFAKYFYTNPDNSSKGTLDPPEKVVLTLVDFKNRTFNYEYDFKSQIRGLDINTAIIDEKATFNPEVFFNFILPPIIFCAGYSMKRRHFFRNLGAILCLAFVGTSISCLVVGSSVFAFTRLVSSLRDSFAFNDCLLFGAVISATDPVTILAIFNDLNVDVDLFALVFGESVLNDAVAIVLSQAIEKYGKLSATGVGFQWHAVLTAFLSFLGVFFGALSIGIAMGCITALITKYTKLRDHPLLETCFFVLMSYSTFLTAEVAKTTGIVAVLFCGICQAHYTYNNLSTESKARTKDFFELLNFLAESFTFLYIGVSIFTFRQHVWSPLFILFAFIGILVGRAANIYPLCALLNLGRKNKITTNKMHMLMFSGLRGAIAFALAIRNTSSESRKILFSTTLVIVITTVLLCGGLTTQMLRWLKIRTGIEETDASSKNNAPFDVMKTLLTPDGQPNPDASGYTESEDGINRQKYKKAWFAKGWHSFDVRILKPLLTHARPLLTETCPACCFPLAQILTTEEQMVHAAVNRDLTDDAEAIIDDISVMDNSSTNHALAPSGDSFHADPVSSSHAQTIVQLHHNGGTSADPV